MKSWWWKFPSTPSIRFLNAINSSRLGVKKMSLQWTDVYDIAIELYEAHPEVDPRYVNFVDLRNWVLALEDFADNPGHCGEKVLEAIQLAWIEESAG